MSRVELSKSRPAEAGASSDSSALFLLNRSLVAVLLSLCAIAQLASILPKFAGRWRQLDFSQWYVEATALKEGINPYTTELHPLAARLGMHLPDIHPYYGSYPPTFLIGFEPLVLLSPATAYWIWLGLGAAALVGILYLTVLSEEKFTSVEKVSLVALAILFYPVIIHFRFAQVQLLLLFMLLGVARLLEKKVDAAAGLLLAATILLKIYPFVMVIYLVIRQRWRALLYTGLGLLGGALITVVIFGFSRSLPFLGRLLFVNGLMGSESVAGAITQVFQLFQSPIAGHWVDTLRRIVIAFAEIGLVCLSIFATLRPRAISCGIEPAFGLWLIVTVLLVNTSRNHYAVFFIPSMVQLTMAAKYRMVSAWVIGLGAFAYVWATFVGHLTTRVALSNVPLSHQLEGLHFLAAAAIYVVAFQLSRPVESV